MSNMSYCRFENTSIDLADCLEALSNGVNIDNLSSDYERKGYKRLIHLCCDIALDFGTEVAREMEESE